MKWNAETIKSARAVLKITQKELAEEMNTRQQTISEWECGLYTPGRAYQRILTWAFDEITRKRQINACVSDKG